MQLSTRQKITRHLLNARGWRTAKKLVVIESDDWGTIRMASRQAFEYFKGKNIPVADCPYCSNDVLESNEDMLALFDTLTSVKDSHGKAAVLTANNIVANPDFEKIAASDFTQYFYEPFTITLQKYPAHHLVADLYRQGIQAGIFIPQFHGREHLNVQRWLTDLQRGDEMAKLAFSRQMFSLHTQTNPAVVNEYMDALDADNEVQLQSQHQIITEGLSLFRQLWGFDAASFIAPCYIWSSSLEPTLQANGVRYIQGVVNQLQPTGKPGYKYNKTYHYQGQKNTLGQYYLVRNVFFEPTTNPAFDWVSDALQRVQVAFTWHKPAIISTHRLNFMGSIREDNRTQNLALLKKLLQQIVKRWPDVEFVDSATLGDHISRQKN